MYDEKWTHGAFWATCVVFFYNMYLSPPQAKHAGQTSQPASLAVDETIEQGLGEDVKGSDSSTTCASHSESNRLVFKIGRLALALWSLLVAGVSFTSMNNFGDLKADGVLQTLSLIKFVAVHQLIFMLSFSLLVWSVFPPKIRCPKLHALRGHGPNTVCEKIRRLIVVVAIIPLLSALCSTQLESGIVTAGGVPLPFAYAGQSAVWMFFFWASCYWQHDPVELHAEDSPCWSCEPGVRFKRAITTLRGRFSWAQHDLVDGN